MDPDPLLQDLGRVLRRVDDQEIRSLVRALVEAPATHLAGTGRSGLIVRSFAMRLTELGLRAHVLGESSTPACRQGDLLLLCSGSGRSPTLLVAAEQAVRAGARLALVTAAVLAPLTRMAHVRIFLPPLLPSAAPTPGVKYPSEAPDETGLVSGLRTLYEQSCFLFFDSLVPLLLEATGQQMADLEARHPNLD